MSAVKKTGYLLPKENQNKTQYKTAKRKAKKRKCAYFLRELFFPVICAYIKYCAVERMRKRVKSKEKERESYPYGRYVCHLTPKNNIKRIPKRSK